LHYRFKIIKTMKKNKEITKKEVTFGCFALLMCFGGAAAVAVLASNYLEEYLGWQGCLSSGSGHIALLNIAISLLAGVVFAVGAMGILELMIRVVDFFKPLETE